MIRFYSAALLLLLCACRNNSDPVQISEQAIDSVITAYKAAKPYAGSLKQFYGQRGGRPGWTSDGKINDHAEVFIRRVIRDSTIQKHSALVTHVLDIYNDPERKKLKENTRTAFDVLMSAVYFEYAASHWQGVRDKYVKIAQWKIERKKMDYAALLDSLLQVKPGAMENYYPVYRQYVLLEDYLRKYKGLNEPGQLRVPESVASLREGTSHPSVALLKQKLFLLGDLKKEDQTALFDSDTKTALERFQARHGLQVTGIPDKETIMQLNVPLDRRIQTIEINMERCRWMPEHFEGDNIIVNIPEYRLHYNSDDKVVWSCNVVVGSDSNNTVIFNDYMEYVVFSPNWNVPKSIVANEVLPAMRKNGNYLETHNMEVVNDKGEPVTLSEADLESDELPYQIRQKPGASNALGRVKFLLPNSHSIYLHDTPSKSLFGEEDRAFSHGCVRVSEPVKLAEYVLRDQPEWNSQAIHDAMYAEEEKTVKLKKRIPVYLTYFTAWVDEHGDINFRDDVYGLDQRMFLIPGI